MKVCDLYAIVMGLITKDDATILKKDISITRLLVFFYVYRFFAWRKKNRLSKNLSFKCNKKKNCFLGAISLSQASIN